MGRSFPAFRARRLRSHDSVRRLVRQISLSVSDLICPLFVREMSVHQVLSPVPGVWIYNVDGVVAQAKEIDRLGIPAVLLFPVLEPAQKDHCGSQATAVQGIMPRAIQAVKAACPHLSVITDVALDPYTDHGHDGICLEPNRVLNDETIAVLARQALLHVQAGADMVAPSDMMDGRVRAIRQMFETHGLHDAKILAYSAKYHSHLYGPFRSIVGSTTSGLVLSKATYQMDYANRDEVLAEVSSDLEEGADLIMVKPGSFYLDIVHTVKMVFPVPLVVYQVSGEYMMIKAAAEQGWIDERLVVMESLVAMKRAGADAIVSYFAPEVARWLTDASE